MDVQPFKDAVAGVQQQMLEENEDIQDLYNHIQQYNQQVDQELQNSQAVESEVSSDQQPEA